MLLHAGTVNEALLKYVPRLLKWLDSPSYEGKAPVVNAVTSLIEVNASTCFAIYLSSSCAF